MTGLKIGVVTGLMLVAMLALSVQPARAAGLDSGTIVTFEKPIEIPGKVLPAGTYEFLQSGSTLVQIWNWDQSRLVATLLTNAAEQQEFAPHQEFEFDSPQHGAPSALRAWFFDSGELGHEFIYPDLSRK
jgi:hypothetical protein